MDKELIKRYFNNTATPDESKKVEAWLADPVYNEDIVKHIQSLWETEKFDAESVLPFESMFQKAKQREDEMGGKLRETKSFSFWIRMAAACFIFLISGTLLGYFIENQSKPDQKWGLSTAQTGRGQSAQLMLSDGFEVLLNEESKIFFSKEKDVYPVVYLEGEASFKMTKNVNKVVIKTKDLVTTTTKNSTINISAFPKDSVVTVSVQEGKAEVRSNEESFPLMKLKIPVKDTSASDKNDTTSKKVLPLVKIRPVVVKYVVKDNESIVFNKNNKSADINITVEEQKTSHEE